MAGAAAALRHYGVAGRPHSCQSECAGAAALRYQGAKEGPSPAWLAVLGLLLSSSGEPWEDPGATWLRALLVLQLGNKSPCWYYLHHPRGLDTHISGKQNLCLKHLGIYLMSSYHSPLFRTVNNSLSKLMHIYDKAPWCVTMPKVSVGGDGKEL